MQYTLQVFFFIANNCYIYAFSRHFYLKRLTVHSGFFFFSICVPWELNLRPLSHRNFILKVMLLQTEYNEVVVLQQGRDSFVHNSSWLFGKVTSTRKLVKKVNTYKVRCRDISWKLKRLKRKMEVKLQFKREPYSLHGPSLRFETFFKCDGHTKKKKKKIALSVVSEFVVGVWDGLYECEILSQSCSVLHGGCSALIQS